MAHFDLRRPDTTLDSPTLVEGFPGVGLVGKIAVDHLIEERDMVHHADVYCESLPAVAAYGTDDPTVRTPVRLYADDDKDLLALQSDVPIDATGATEVGKCLGGLISEHDVTPVYMSGLPTEEKSTPPAMHGIATGDGTDLLADAGIDAPATAGIVSGPTGALLHHAAETDTTAVGLVVESNPKFPDPEAARVLIEKGIQPLTGVELPVQDLIDSATEIREAKERLAERMQQTSEESTQAQPLGMYQ